MSDSKHTPGPWFARGRYIGTRNHMSYVGECRDVNGNWCDDAKACADASLIAAAPELLDLAKLVQGSFGGGRTVTFSDDDIAAFSAVISKAEGKR